MSLTYDIFNPECGIPIYETPTEDVWVKCSMASARRGSYIAAAIIVIMIIMLYFSIESWFGKAAVIIGGLLLTGGIIAGVSAFGDRNARFEWKQYNQRVDGLMRDLNMNRPAAIAELRSREEKKREQAIAERQANALNKSANANMVNALNNITTRFR